MLLDLDSGCLRDVLQISSPNFSYRPENTPIDLIIIHGISLPPGCFGGPWVEQFFTNQLDHSAHDYFLSLIELKVSAHVFIRRDGSLIQFVPFTHAAWHAGVSEFKGRSRCNEFSIGIELEGIDTYPYELEQYRVLVALVKVLMQAYPLITPQRIIGHSEVAPGRKTDPGPAFDWAYFFKLLNEHD